MRVETAHEFQHGSQQHTDDQNSNNVQLWTPFAVKNQHADNRCERQNGVERWSGGGDFADIHHLMADVLFFIEIALPEEMRDPHSHNGDNRDRQRGLKGEVDQRHLGCFGGQHNVARGWGKNNGGR